MKKFVVLHEYYINILHNWNKFLNNFMNPILNVLFYILQLVSFLFHLVVQFYKI